MQRKYHPIAFEEKSGNQYASLQDAQREALPLLSLHLSSVIHDLLASGDLIQVNGKIIPRENR
ncbi:MAG: hypothetical protein HYR70_02100 [Chloroflexi bacterium]|nr:hypothetical protein [Chloroflexota bacterium]MBI3341017.1 hypothetical protein [Chloroflexota bacterium]